MRLPLPVNPAWIAAIAAWVAALLLVQDTPRILQVQVGLILLIGLALILYALKQDVEVSLAPVFASNTGLLTMIAAVGFLRLVALPEANGKSDLPVGKKAYLQTLLGISLFSSVINISAPMLIADRIHQQRPLQRFSAQSITRVFSGCASWSPFFGAMAVVLTYVGDAHLLWIASAGFPFMLAGLAVVYFEARLRYAKEVAEFVGYPMHLSSLKIPSLLVFTVIAGNRLLPDTPVLVVIALSALFVTSLILVTRHGAGHCLRQLQQYVVLGLPRIVNELTLFLAAGVLAAGISAMIHTGLIVAPFASFETGTAIQLLGIILIAAAMGIHPVILISSFTPLILTLNPEPNLLALTYLLAWNLGTNASPLSGTHLVFQGRYGIPSWKGAIWNWPYVLVMYLIAAAWLPIAARFFA